MSLKTESRLRRIPSVFRDPTALEGLVRRREADGTTAPMPVTPPGHALPIAWQLSRQHLDALREEINAAEPVLTNVYEDKTLFTLRETGLNEIMEILYVMRQAVDKCPFSEGEKKLVKQDIDALTERIHHIVLGARHRNMPLLQPVPHIAADAPDAPRTAANVVDIAFVLSRSVNMRRDIKLLARHIRDFYFDMVNFGLDVRLGLEPFSRAGRPAGPMRDNPDAFIEDIQSVPLVEGDRNSLTAVRNALEDFSYRAPSHRFIVLFVDNEADDDIGTAREQTIDRLRESRATLFALSVLDSLTKKPLSVYNDLARATKGRYFNIENIDYRSTLAALAGTIAETVASSGAPIIMSNERTIPLGPSHDDTLQVKFPDFRPAALGISDLRLETRDDFQAACSIIERALESASEDVMEKRILNNHLDRILTHFDSIRYFRLDFQF